MEDLFWIGFVGAAIALLFAWLQRSRVMSFSEGNERCGRSPPPSVRAQTPI